jgi:hypothetical protein
MAEWNISKLTGELQKIATEIDSSGKDGCVQDGFIKGEKEISLFLDGVNEAFNRRLISQGEKDTIFENYFDKNNTEVLGDALVIKNIKPPIESVPVEKTESKILMANEIENTNVKLKSSSPNKIGSNSDISNKYEWSEEAFDKVLEEMLNAPRYKGKFKNSILRSQAKAFIETGKKYNIDPRLIAAVAMQESARGTSSVALKYNNVGGLMANGGYIKFSTPAESIDSIGKTLQSRYNEGYNTPVKIAQSGRYCAKKASAEWLQNVNSYLSMFDKNYTVE